MKIEKFEKLVQLVKHEKEIGRKDLQGYNIVTCTKKFIGAQELKNLSGRILIFSNAYNKYEKAYDYLQELKNIETLEITEIYKYFVRIEHKILNKYGYEVSGGERSEFNLLQEIADAQQFDMLLIDEPESSFDNLFLKSGVNELIKNISKSMPVIVVTHNNTVGISINPDYIIYTKKKIHDGAVIYEIYTGYPANKKLKSLTQDTVLNHDILLDCLEAGIITYKERGESYEMLKN